MPNVKNTILDTLLSAVAPHLCSGCGRVGTTFCDNCKYDISAEHVSGCILCEKSTDSGICIDHKAPFNQAWVVGMRTGALQRLIGGYKFRNMKAASRELAYLLHRRLPYLNDRVVIVPIPTASSHVRERGYDHMLLIAQRFAKKRGLRVESSLRRTHNDTQHHANRSERMKQAKSAYALSGPIDANKIYLVIDDVFTTGATIFEATHLLKGAGATVWVAVIAKQPLD